ncbi:MAG TPA: 2-dehydropantoate 2-reductase [Gaiellaceae bacterium]|nr:2-dehydropantoate 2-reductase [Gaiellaceae bacterium]
MKIAVFGAGGVGGYFGGRLARAGADVHLIARGAHLRALREHGLRVRSVRGDFEVSPPATDDPADIGACDVVFFCVKAYDTDEAARRLSPLLHRETAVISLQNGVDNEEKLAAVVGSTHVLPGAAFIFASIGEPGVVVDAGGPGSLVFGEPDGVATERGQRLLALCKAAGVPAEFVPDIRVRLWAKFVFICAQAGMTACTRLPIGEIRATPASWEMFRRILAEVAALAAAEDVALPADQVASIMAFAEALEPGGFSSLYHDLVGGRRMELEALHGFVVRRSRHHGLPAPMTEAVYALLKPHADAADPSSRRGLSGSG